MKNFLCLLFIFSFWSASWAGEQRITCAQALEGIEARNFSKAEEFVARMAFLLKQNKINLSQLKNVLHSKGPFDPTQALEGPQIELVSHEKRFKKLIAQLTAEDWEVIKVRLENLIGDAEAKKEKEKTRSDETALIINPQFILETQTPLEAQRFLKGVEINGEKKIVYSVDLSGGSLVEMGFYDPIKNEKTPLLQERIVTHPPASTYPIEGSSKFILRSNGTFSLFDSADLKAEPVQVKWPTGGLANWTLYQSFVRDGSTYTLFEDLSADGDSVYVFKWPAENSELLIGEEKSRAVRKKVVTWAVPPSEVFQCGNKSVLLTARSSSKRNNELNKLSVIDANSGRVLKSIPFDFPSKPRFSWVHSTSDGRFTTFMETDDDAFYFIKFDGVARTLSQPKKVFDISDGLTWSKLGKVEYGGQEYLAIYNKNVHPETQTHTLVLLDYETGRIKAQIEMQGAKLGSSILGKPEFFKQGDRWRGLLVITTEIIVFDPESSMIITAIKHRFPKDPGLKLAVFKKISDSSIELAITDGAVTQKYAILNDSRSEEAP